MIFGKKSEYEIVVNNPDGGENPYHSYRVGFYRNGAEVGPEDLPNQVRTLEGRLKEIAEELKGVPRILSLKVRI